jgi:SPX domain protein involved in polyphosphate accumulation
MYRYERKFRSHLYDLKDLVALVKSNRALFMETYSPRVVNSIYLDTNSYSFAQDNLAGISDRVKPRVRWYGQQDKEIKDGVLELKYKNNLLGRKEKYLLGSLTIAKSSFRNQLNNKLGILWQDNPNLIFLKELNASLMTRYNRRYFESGDRKFRITIDTDIHYWSFSQFGRRAEHPYKDHDLIILELKYDQDVSGLQEVLRDFPFRFSKSSKYVTGILST